MTLSSDLIADIQFVARGLNLPRGQGLSFSQYRQAGGSFTKYRVLDVGHSWQEYCEAAGYATKGIPQVSNDELMQRYAVAFKKHQRKPKKSELKDDGLRFRPRPGLVTIRDLHDKARDAGLLPLEPPAVQAPSADVTLPFAPVTPASAADQTPASGRNSGTPPPIPRRTKYKKWERIDVDGFPYAPHDELGVAALFAILCSNGSLPYDLLQLNGGKGIDTICWDREQQREVRIELKYTLTKGSWNHAVDDLDLLVCWKNAYPAFPKPVLILHDCIAAGAG